MKKISSDFFSWGKQMTNKKNIHSTIEEECKIFEEQSGKYYSEDLQEYCNNSLKEAIDLFQNKSIFYQGIEEIFLFNSHSIKPQHSVERGIIEKNILLFSNLKKIIILTEKEGAKSEEVKRQIGNHEIKIAECIVKYSNFKELYDPFKLYLREKVIDRKKIVFDMTLGMKFASTAFYKLAVEEGIEVINWVELQTEKGIRKPWTVKIERFAEPIRENLKMKELINKNLKNYNFFTIATLYDMQNDKDKVDFYNLLGEIIPYELLLFSNQSDDDVIKFINNVDRNREKIEKFSKNMHGSYRNYLEALLKVKNKEEPFTKSIYEMIKIDFYISSIQNSNMLYDNLINIGAINYGDEYAENIVQEKEERLENILDEYLKLKFCNIEDEEIREEIIDKIRENFLKNLAIINFLEEDKKNLFLKNGILYIEKLNLNLDLNLISKATKIGKVVGTKLGDSNESEEIIEGEICELIREKTPAIIKYLINKNKKSLSKKEVQFLLYGDEFDIDLLSEFEKRDFRVKEKRMRDFINGEKGKEGFNQQIKKLNSELQEVLEKTFEKEFIILSTDGSYKINEILYKLV